jgi:hypothetical protein
MPGAAFSEFEADRVGEKIAEPFLFPRNTILLEE